MGSLGEEELVEMVRDYMESDQSTTPVSLRTSCWWEKPLVVALKHSEGIKHTVLFQEQKLTNTQKLTIHALSLLSSVSLYSLHTE